MIPSGYLTVKSVNTDSKLSHATNEIKVQSKEDVFGKSQV